jgi:hypothetical protein
MSAVLAAVWLLLTAPPAAPEVVPTAPPPATQAPPAPASSPAGQPAPPTSPSTPAAQPDSQTEEPSGALPPDPLGQGKQAQQLWEARLHAAYDDAEARQGPLDGRWQLTGADGDPLFVMVISDPGGANLAGAWRDLRRGSGAQGSGFLTIGARTSDGVDIRFTEPGQSAETVLQLRPTADGRWGGELTESGSVGSVVLSRF